MVAKTCSLKGETSLKLLSIERAHAGTGRLRDLAKFNVQINDDLRLVGVRLVEDPSGRRFVYAQSAGGSRCVTFSTRLAEALTGLASEAFNNLEDRKSDDRQHAA